MILFGDTGIQILELPYLINTKKVNAFEGSSELFRLIENSWTPIVFDKSKRDYARIFWRSEEKGTETAFVRPILVVDTAIDEGNKGFLTTTDIGREFKSKDSDSLFTQELEELWTSWFASIADQKNMTANNNWVSRYISLINLIANNNAEINLEKENSRKLEGGMLGGFILKSVSETTQRIPVNLYLDLGNTRTTGIIYEDNPAQAAGFNPFHKLRLYNYTGYFNRINSNSVKYGGDVFPSLIEFRKSPFPDLTTSETFKLFSLAATGVEAFSLKTNFENKSGHFTGLSAPKRYLWDGDPFHSNWHFSDSNSEKIYGELLRYISLTDKDEFTDDNVQKPVEPVYPRRTGMIFFLVEILEQVIRQINSPEYQEHSQPGRPRLLSRLTVSYPTAFSQTMRKRLLKQLEKAIEIIQNKYVLDDELSFSLGIDEAATVQTVFLQSQVANLKSRFSSFISSTSYSSEDQIRIASIDVGGGTTDMMVAEYDTRDFHTSHRFNGEILDIDGVQYGGDDIVKTIIDELIIDRLLKEQLNIEDQIDTLFRTSDDNRLRNIRLNYIYLISRPIAIAYLMSLSDDEVKKLLNKEYKIDKLCDEILHKLGFFATSRSFEYLKKSMVEKIGDSAQALMNDKLDFSAINSQDVENIIISSPLITNYLKTFSTKIAKYNPSYVLLAGKLSEIPTISDRLRLYLPTSPDRVVSMSKFPTGKWYPFHKDGKINDPKTTVSIGLGISDIAKNANQRNGLSVYINENDDIVDQDYYLLHDHSVLMDRNNLIMKSGDNESREVYVNSDLKYIYGSRYNGLGKIYGSPQYELSLKNKIEEFPEDPPRLKFKKLNGELKIDENSLTGKIINNGVEQEFSIEDVDLKLKTISEGDYYLDTGII